MENLCYLVMMDNSLKPAKSYDWDSSRQWLLADTGSGKVWYRRGFDYRYTLPRVV